MLGQQVGNYRITGVLGEGGMGRVYLAEHPGLGRRAAVKVLRPDMAQSQEMIERFFDEARAANAIGHPGIVEVHDFGTLPSGDYYIAMEFLDGESLSSRLARAGRRPPAEAVEIASQVAGALGAAHAKGIIHRDLKPEHIFLLIDHQRPGRERVKILDFGIAKLSQRPDSAGPGPTRTAAGAIMGTPRYMSPEQCRASRDVDHRTDIYALGIILHEMVAGAPPFVSESWGDLVHMHIGVAPPPLRAAQPSVGETLERVVLQALAKDPDDRFQSMADFLDALRAVSEPAPAPTQRLPPAAPAPPSAAPPIAAPVLTTLAASASAFLREVTHDHRSRWIMSGLALGAFLIAMALTMLAGSRWRPPSPAAQRPALPTPASAPTRPPIDVAIAPMPTAPLRPEAPQREHAGPPPVEREEPPLVERGEPPPVERGGLPPVENGTVPSARHPAAPPRIRPSPAGRPPVKSAAPARPAAARRREPVKI